jgi:hypothetical protein
MAAAQTVRIVLTSNGQYRKDKIKARATGRNRHHVGRSRCAESTIQFTNENNRAPETVLTPHDPHSPRCNGAFARAFRLGDSLVRGISDSNLFPKNSFSTLYATSTSFGHLISQPSRLIKPALKELIPTTIRLNYLVLCANFGEPYLQVAAGHQRGPDNVRLCFTGLGEHGKCVARNVRPLTQNHSPSAAAVAARFLMPINPANPANIRLNGAGSRSYSVT